MSRKIGFWSVFELVTFSQVGSGLILPANLAAYGSLSLLGWGVSATGALLLAIMFSLLCIRFPRTGGPHAYVQEAFGSSAAFFTGWTYWVISWISTTAIITAAVGYAIPFIGNVSATVEVGLEILIVIGITTLNLKGVYRAGKTNFTFIALNMLPLIAVPVIALFYFDASNFTPAQPVFADNGNVLNNVILLTLWGFIGFEAATTAAADVHNPSRTIPLALICGTLFVGIIYFISSLGIMGVIPGNELVNSQAPYSDTILHLFGGNWHLIISFIACMVCIRAVNAWTLATGQIALGITQDGLMPKFFARKNKHGAPRLALLISAIGSIPLLVLTQSDNLADKVETIIDLSVTAFIFVYVISCCAFLRILWMQKRSKLSWQWVCGILSLAFCLWITATTPVKTLMISSLFVLSGLPIFLIYRRRFGGQASNDSEYNQPSMAA